MSIDLGKEQIVGLSEASRSFPRKPSYHKLHRWAEFGVLAKNGRQVFLETIKVGGEPCTSVEAFQRFCEQLSTEEMEAEDDC